MKKLRDTYIIMLISVILGAFLIPLALIESIVFAPLWLICTGNSYFDEWNVSTMSLSALNWAITKMLSEIDEP